MENRLLFGRPRRRKWPRKMSPFVKVTAILEDSSKPRGKATSFPKSLHPPLPVDNMVATVFDCLRERITGYPTYEFLGQWGSALLYTPYETAAAICINMYAVILNLPPFFKLVVLPLVLLYIFYQTATLVLDEYQSFMDLGRGGTPSTPMGLIKVTMKKFFAHVDVLDPPHVDPMLEPYRGILFDTLKTRAGERPTVKGVAPQRQFDQKASIDTFNRLLQMLKDMASGSDNLKVTTSYLEGHTDALKGVFADIPHEVWGTDGEWDYEIAHPHRVDGSMHAILHPEDVRTVIERGWGERHPLATDAWWWKIFYHYIRLKRRPTPYNLVLVYAPRTNKEHVEIRKIIEAAVWFHHEKYNYDQAALGNLARQDDGTFIDGDYARSTGRWVDGPDGRLITVQRALDRRFYKLTPCGGAVVPTFVANVAPVPLPTDLRAELNALKTRSTPAACGPGAAPGGGYCG